MRDLDQLSNQPKDLPIDPERLKKLEAEIEAVTAEVNDPNRKPTQKELNGIDPSKFPETYRERIQHYYQELSDHS